MKPMKLFGIDLTDNGPIPYNIILPILGTLNIIEGIYYNCLISFLFGIFIIARSIIYPVKRKPKKIYYCDHCKLPITEKQNVFIFCGGTVVVHNTVECIWEWTKKHNTYLRNYKSIPFKTAKKILK